MRLSLKRRKDVADPAPAQPPAQPRPVEPPANLPEYEPVVSADPLAELGELMAANRADPDPATEKRIVQLRHEAFAELDRSRDAALADGANGHGAAAPGRAARGARPPSCPPMRCETASSVRARC